MAGRSGPCSRDAPLARRPRARTGTPPSLRKSAGSAAFATALRLPLIAVAALLCAAPAAHAATPASGTVDGSRVIKWSGEAAGAGVNVLPRYPDLRCDAPFCDSYALTVATTGLPTLTVTAQQATGFTYVYVVDPSGVQTKYTTGSGEPKLVIDIEDAAPGAYTIKTYTNVFAGITAGSYGGAAKLTLPPVS